MCVNTDSKLFQMLSEGVGALLAGILGNTYASNIKSPGCKFINEAENVNIVGNAKISANFIFVNVVCADHNHNFRLIGKLHQHTEFAVRFKARKNSGGMVIVKKLSAEFQVKFVAKLADTFPDMFGLHFQVFCVVKSNLHLFFLSFLI